MVYGPAWEFRICPARIFPIVGADQFYAPCSVQVNGLDCVVFEKCRQGLFGFRCAVFPEGVAKAVPSRCEPNFVGVRVLNDEPLERFRMTTDDAKANRPAIVLDEEAVAIETLQLQECFNDFGDFIKRVGERGRIWQAAVPETRIVGRENMEAIRQGGKQISVLMRRGRESV